MVSSDVLGYPIKKHFWRMGLETAWKAAFGALDIGDFETFLKNSADRTYADALKQIEIIGGKSESRRTQEGKEEFEKGSTEQYQAVAENLRQSGDEYHASAIDALIAELVAEKNKPKRAARAKPAPKPKQLETFVPPIHPQSLPPVPHGKDYDWLYKIITADGLDDLELASREIQLPHTDLTEQDRKELQALLNAKRKELQKTYKSSKRIMKVVKPAPVREPTSKIRTFKEVSGKREKEEEKGERILPFKAVEYEFHDINLQNAKLFLRDYQQYLPGILEMGLQNWLEAHRTAFKFPLTTHNLTSLASALQFSIIQPEQKNVRVMVAVQFLSKHAPDILVRGLEKASGNFNWSTVYSYYKDTLKTELPPIEVFKKDVLTVTKGIKFEF